MDKQVQKSSINPFHVSNFEDISKWLQDVNENDILWFRGQENHKWPLIPSIYRKAENFNEKEKMKKTQKQAIYEFINRKRHLIFKYQPAPNLIPENDQYFLWLSIMQHHGYDTCLLDFSEHLLPSLLFALNKYFSNDRFNFSGERPGLWILKPLVFNKIVIGRHIKDFFDIDENNLTIPTIEQIKNGKKFINEKVAILFPHNSDRILLQSGCFVSFPVEVEQKNGIVYSEIEKVAEEFSLDRTLNAKNFLSKWIIDDPDRLVKEIKLMGFNIDDIYLKL